MCGQVGRWKEKWKIKGDESKPKWMDPTVWNGLVRYWMDPKSKKKSDDSRKARYSDPDGYGPSKHRSGQTSFKARGRNIVSFFFKKNLTYVI